MLKCTIYPSKTELRHSIIKMYSKETERYIANEFPTLKDVCYLDHAATTLYAESQITSVFKELNENVFGNPHSLNLSSRQSADIIDQVRYRVLKHYHTDSEEYSVIFTSGATAALKLVAESFNWKGINFQKHDTPNHVLVDYKNEFLSTVNEECPCTAKSCLIKAQSNGKHGSFVYLQDNHTSVLGMRELASERGACVHCMTHDFAFSTFSRKNVTNIIQETAHTTNSLFVYPAQCNFSGLKYPLTWIDKVQSGYLNCTNKECCHQSKWFCFLDAASYVSTNDLDLSVIKPDFVGVSFYKLFGYPTGIGALLVRNASAHTLQKVYFGGGTVLISLSTENFHALRPALSDQFEDGTIPFLSIIALRHGFDTLQRLTGGMVNITLHTLFLARYVHHNLLLMHHSNGSPAVVLYCDTDYEDFYTQGNIVNFNLLRANGEYIGFAEVLHMANLYGIHLRTGCFCNPGACQRHLNLSARDLRNHFQAGHVCGDEMDLINGRPTGSVRISFGYMSTKHDADKFLDMITSCFIDCPLVRKVPQWWPSFCEKYREKFGFKSCKSGVCSDDDSDHHKSNNLNNSNEILLFDTLIPSHISENENSRHVEDVSDDELSMKLTQNLSFTKEVNQICREPENNVSSNVHLKHIYVYPIKSCGAMSVKSWKVSRRGLLYDREWMIVMPSGVCLTQKHETRLCLISPKIDLELQCLVLNFEGAQPVCVPLGVPGHGVGARRQASLCQSKVCGDRVQGWDCGDEVATWLSAVLHRQGLRLLRHWDCAEARTGKANSPGGLHPELSLSNQAQFLLVNMGSIQWLLDKLQDSRFTKENLLSRFRCNLAVEGLSAFEETQWASLEVSNVNFSVEGPCTRCQIICIDQQTGERTKEPLRTLAESFHGKLRFGIYLRHNLQGNNTATLSVNDPITVL